MKPFPTQRAGSPHTKQQQTRPLTGTAHVSLSDFPLLKPDELILATCGWQNAVLITETSKLSRLKDCMQQAFMERGLQPNTSMWELTPHIKTGPNREQFVNELRTVAPRGIRLNPAYIRVYGNSLQWQFVLGRTPYHFTLVYCETLSTVSDYVVQQCIANAMRLYFYR
jgi:hypothetical protein